ncbi:thiamine pyrophosphate-binding protein [Rhodococcus ruber]|uniref:acetolactate synthase n=1 Tax=Rhodococcus ruber TaxID=1830 RepID=A0ABT4MED3_9NOCA|nr:thiamine pyrophosphate-binding protein [Rhodococcus ruber]MCZ4519345.1 thiamine pyrophosphate-binding protein [Rhodococcus ruber]
MKLTGAQIIARTLKEFGVEYVAGIPGHGAWTFLDGFLDEESKIPVIQVFHEQSAVHLADGYYRATGRPMAAFTSIGPGATNTVIGMATAYADSSAVLLLTGGPHTHMVGNGIMQELERKQDNEFPEVLAPVTKRHWVANRTDKLPSILHRAFSAMLTGRPGPVHIEIAMDVQAAAADVQIPKLHERLPVGKIYPDPEAVNQAVALLAGAKRPVIVVGGGALLSNASEAVLELATKLKIPVVTTYNGKSTFPEDHDLFGGDIGYIGSTSGNKLAADADVVLSVGNRFTDWSASSYRKGATFSFPPAKLIQIDIDPHEIGKNYPVAVGIVADAVPAVSLIAAQSDEVANRDDYLGEVIRLRQEWKEKLAPRLNSDASPMTSQRPLKGLREILPRDAIVVAGSGNAQGTVKQTFDVYEPKTHFTSGSFSPMGWAVPAAMGVKLGRPDKIVVCVVGDGEFLMGIQEIGVAVTHNIPVVFLVQNNSGYISIRGGQRKMTGRYVASEFATPDGEPYSPDYLAIGRAFGLKTWRAETPEEVDRYLKEAIESGEPAIVEAMTARDAAGPFVPGWWDLPVSADITDERQDEYWEGRALQQHL